MCKVSSDRRQSSSRMDSLSCTDSLNRVASLAARMGYLVDILLVLARPAALRIPG